MLVRGYPHRRMGCGGTGHVGEAIADVPAALVGDHQDLQGLARLEVATADKHVTLADLGAVEQAAGLGRRIDHGGAARPDRDLELLRIGELDRLPMCQPGDLALGRA